MKSKNNTNGFTIIEVLIVLAIAAVIALLGLSAISLIKRNMANDARKREAAQYVQDVRECLTNSSGNKTRCDTKAEVALPPTVQGVYSDVIFCGSGGPAGQTGCGTSVDGFPDFALMYANGYDYSSSTNWPFFEVRYGHKCSSYPNRSQPATTSSIAVMVPYVRADNTSYSKCYDF